MLPLIAYSCIMSFQPTFWEEQSLFKKYRCLIAGGGLTGLHTALQMKKKYGDMPVAILERGPFSLGASTRNAGFACFGSLGEILDDLQHMQVNETFELVEKRYRGLAATKNLLGEKAIEFEQKGSHELFTKQNQHDYKAVLDYLPQANKLLKELTGLDEVYRQTNNLSGFAGAIGAIFNPWEAQLHSGKLYTCLRQKAIDSGVDMLGGCEVSHWGSSGEKVMVSLKTGMTFETDIFILATNAFTRQLMPNEDIVPARGQVLLTEKLKNLPVKGTYHFDKGYYYWRDLDGRILLGGARNSDLAAEQDFSFAINNKVQQVLEQFLYEQILAGNQKPAIAMRWSGIMAMGSKKKPIIKQLGPGIFMLARMGGMGVALSPVAAAEAVALI